MTDPAHPAPSAPGAVLLQGGAEMRPACREMDGELVALAPPGPLVVLLGAATPGSDHERAARRATTYYSGSWPDRSVRVAPHPEDDLDACVVAVQGAAVVVLPGGSPSRLLAGLRLADGRLAVALLDAHRSGAALSGASAGAMVLCARTVLPDAARGGAGPADGVGLVPGLALVHDDGTRDRGWSDGTDPFGVRWGLPEAGGVLVHRGLVRAVGQGSPRLLRGTSSRDVPRTTTSLTDLLRR